jgi:hypothetical protein
MTYPRCGGQLKVGQGLVRDWTQAACAAEVLTGAMQFEIVQGPRCSLGFKGKYGQERKGVGLGRLCAWVADARTGFQPMS